MEPLFIGAATDLGVNIKGANLGPQVILENIKHEGKIIKISSHYQKEEEGLAKNKEEIKRFNQELFNYIRKKRQTQIFPICIGGDHSLAIASALASADFHKKIGIIWVDAHADFNTLKTTITGNIHGIPLACITNKEKDMHSFTSEYINSQNTVIIGARSIDPLEKKNLEEEKITVFTSDDIQKLGVKYVVEEAIKIATNNTLGFHLSYDLDVIDPILAPGVSVPEKDGINLQQAYLINDLLLKSNKVLAYDLVEYNPLKDKNEQTLKIALELLKQVMKNLN